MQEQSTETPLSKNKGETSLPCFAELDIALGKDSLYEEYPHAEISVQFFKKVQNKIRYAIHGQMAAEVIYTRADAEKDFMGLTTFAETQPTLREAVIAKNYLDDRLYMMYDNKVAFLKDLHI